MKVGGNLSWFYTDISVESPKVKKTSIFFQNELLVAITRQKYILDIGGTQSIISNNGSVNYYSLGARISPTPYISISAKLTNKLANSNPTLDYYLFDPYLVDSDPNVQYYKRFFPYERPFLALSMEWSR